MQQIHLYPTPVGAMEGLTACLRAAMAATPDPVFNLVLSGGGTAPALFDYWTAGGGRGIDWERVGLFWADERCVSATHPDSNYGAAWTHLLSRLPINPIRIFRIRGEADAAAEAARYAAILEQRRLHFALLGVGADGHTASLFPARYQLWRPDMHRSLCLAVRHPQTGQCRVTMGVGALCRCDRVAYLVTGGSKKTVMGELAADAAAVSSWPSHYIRPRGAPPVFFVGY